MAHLDPSSQPLALTPAKAADTVAQLAMQFPDNPTSGDILRMLSRAEAAGYRRALDERLLEEANALELPS